jgi:DUF1680 family protein
MVRTFPADGSEMRPHSIASLLRMEALCRVTPACLAASLRPRFSLQHAGRRILALPGGFSVSRPIKPSSLNRRAFVAAAASGTAALTAFAADEAKPITQASVPGDPAAPKEQEGTVPPSLPFDQPLAFRRRELALKVEPFPLGSVRLLPSPFWDAQEANRALLHRYSADRLLHAFRINAGLPSSAQPFGGWERPDCELRGHFVGHYLSACALMSASAGDAELKTKAGYIVAELAKCQQRLGGDYLSAFPVELFDRLKARKKVWAPFYTYHKILAGMLDMHLYCDNQQALEVAKGMADWADRWTAALSPDLLQEVLDEEFGGMNEALYNTAVLASYDGYVAVGDRFTKKRFFNPLALRRDQLRGLHANTHIPQVIGAARRYEISSDIRFHDVADAFWQQVAGARTYVTGGTSNNEGWLTEPNHLSQELAQGTATNECCCAYNMLKLARKLYTWSGDPRYFDFYERALYNHRLGTIDTSNGHTQYYLGVVPGSWRTFATEDDSFWCCNGTGVEEYSKLTDSIYFRNRDAVYVNLFIPSELNWTERGVRITQTNQFPSEARTRIDVHVDSPTRLALNIRVPAWVAGFPAVTINGKQAEISAGPGSYLVLFRTWHNGDRVELTLPMALYAEPMPDDHQTQAFLYGPLVLAGCVGNPDLPRDLVVGPMGPDFKKRPAPAISPLRAQSTEMGQWIRPASDPLTFAVTGQEHDLTLAPFTRIGPGQPYSIYWKVV